MTAKKKLNLGDLLSIYAQHRPNSPGVSSPSHPPNPPARSAALTYYPSATQARAGACDEDPIHSEFLNVMTGILSPEVAARGGCAVVVVVVILVVVVVLVVGLLVVLLALLCLLCLL